MAKVLASELAGREAARASCPPSTSTKLKVTGIDLFSAGDFSDDDANNEVVLRDPARGIYKRVVLRDNRLVGAVLYGDTADGAWYFDLLKKGEDVGAFATALIFGQAYQGGSPLDPTAAVAALPDDAEICGCNGVCKGAIVAAIQAKRLDHARRGAGQHQGLGLLRPCAGKVELLLAATLGDAYEKSRPQADVQMHRPDAMRKCAASSSRKSSSRIPAVMQELGWKTLRRLPVLPAGAELLSALRLARRISDDYQSRFVNERVHANIQKDGTFSVVPRMWGGVTTPDELRAIADVADQFKHPDGQGHRRPAHRPARRQEAGSARRLGAISTRPGMVSGHAYGKALRTVKTCVGTEWCRFGTQDSTGLGHQAGEADVGLLDARTRSSSRCPAARAIAPRPRSRISA